MKHTGLMLSALILALLVGCSRPDQQASGDQGPAGSPVPGDWVVIRLESEPENLNPMISSTTNASYVQWGLDQSHVYETLFQFDRSDWTIKRPLLAEAYPEISPDHLVYTVTIRDGIKWHDGKPFSVDDVLFSAKATMCPFVDSARFRGEFSELDNVEVLDGRKIRFTFRKPNVLNVLNIGTNLPIVARHIYDPGGLLDKMTYKDVVGSQSRSDTIKKFAEAFNRSPYNRMPVGTGPYKFEKWETGKELVVVRNDEYWGKKPYLEKIVYRIILDWTAGLTALKAGDTDFNPRMLPIQYAQQTSGTQFESQFVKTTYSLPSFYYIGWNVERPYFKDKRVRQALTMLVDRQEIIKALRFGLATPTETYFHPSSAEFHKDLKPYPYDPARAAQLMDEAGWKDSNGDGVRDKDGVAFRFEMLGSSNSTFTDQILPILKETFRKAGIDMTERRLEFTVMVENEKDHKFDANLGAWVSPLQADPYSLFHSSSALSRGQNYVNFKNPESDRLIEQARLEFDPQKRKDIYWKWQELMYDEQPYTFLFAPQDAAAYHRRFQNVKFYPPMPGYDLPEWFVPQSQQKFTAQKP